MRRTLLSDLQKGDVFYMGSINPNIEHPYKILSIRCYINFNHYECRDMGNQKEFGMKQNTDIFVWII